MTRNTPSPNSPTRPDRQALLAAAGKTIRDVIAADLRVLFCGINPGLYSAAIGHHFGRPGNRFWPALHHAGFTDRLLSGHEDRELLRYGFGITNVVARATAAADELTREELIAGGKELAEKVQRFRPRIVAVLGIGAFRSAFQQRSATFGAQVEPIGDATVWVLPNPSGLNAHYQLADLVEQFRELKRAVDGGSIF